jgi:hypothetical protein
MSKMLLAWWIVCFGALFVAVRYKMLLMAGVSPAAPDLAPVLGAISTPEDAYYGSLYLTIFLLAN